MNEADIGHIPLILRGFIPENDANMLYSISESKIHTPKSFELNVIVTDIVALANAD